MGAASSVAYAADLEKPVDASDIQTLDQAKSEITRMRKLLVDNASTPSDAVASLPGFGVPLERNFAGFVPVNPKNGNIFYWFAESRVNPGDPKTPLIIWLNGGPGASSITGFLAENGPYRLQPNLTLVKNEYAWNNLGHFMIFDQPVGTGFSYCDTDGYCNNEDEVAEQMFAAITGFLELHTEYKQNPVLFTGESYAGKYIPAICTYIHKRNAEAAAAGTAQPPVNLQAIAIGNGLIQPVPQFASIPDQWLAMGFIGDAQAAQAKEQQAKGAAAAAAGDYTTAFNLCNGMSDAVNKWGGMAFLYDVRVFGDPFAAITASLKQYLDKADVRAALHVGEQHWKSSDGTSVPNPVTTHLMSDIMKDALPLLPPLIAAYPTMLYNGQFDGSCCNHVGSTRMLAGMQWPGADAFRDAPRTVWSTPRGAVGGFVRVAGNLTYTIVADSGHLVPANQPEHALDMITRFWKKQPWHVPPAAAAAGGAAATSLAVPKPLPAAGGGSSSAPRPKLGVLLFPNFEMLDVYGSLEVWSAPAVNFEYFTVAETAGPITARDGPATIATYSFDNFPSDMDYLLVPGGLGTRTLVDHAPTLDFLRRVFPTLKFLFTVCTGSALAACAGLLDGLPATSNKMAWDWVTGLPAAQKVKWVHRARWVRTQSALPGGGAVQIMTSSGVSAGMDQAVAYVKEAYGEAVAEGVCKYIEYIPDTDPNNDPFAPPEAKAASGSGEECKAE